MINKPINMEIFLSTDNSLQISCPQKKQYYIWSKDSIKNNKDIEIFLQIYVNKKL